MTADHLRVVIRDEFDHVRAIRHELHRHPELMFQEHRTNEVIRRELEELGINHVSGLAKGTGVLAHLPATSTPETAPTIALRADMDALPIEEDTGAQYTSQTPGVMHACGHDGHTAILLGVARALTNMPIRPNNTTFLFQPAEEGGAGGEKMCNDGALDGSVLGLPVDLIYGLHGWPDLELGTVASRNGPLLAATDEFDITVTGVGGHAAYPHLCVDSIVVAAHIITALQTVVSRNTPPHDSAVVTVGTINAGLARNIIAETTVMQGTLRTLTPERREIARADLERIATNIATSFGASARVSYDEGGYPVTFNDPGATDRWRRIARATLDPARVIERDHPSMGGEDFSYYGAHVPACFFFLGLKLPGVEKTPGLHTPAFDFNDDAIPAGLELMATLALDATMAS